MYILRQPKGINDFNRIEEVECDMEVEAVDDLGNEIVTECDFVGEVDVLLGEGLKTWECPKCGHEHKESWSPEDDIDPDAWRD